jgi:hypothetical protein
MHRAANEQVLPMANGEYTLMSIGNAESDSLTIYSSGTSSDGPWLYSSFHFCNGRAMVRADEPPASIAEFERRYAVREFDGKSHECLKHTPGSW